MLKPTEWTDLVTHLDDDPSTALEAIRRLQELVDEERVRHIGRARESGMSWRRIGEHLGVTAQAVHYRFAWLV